jgi:hypothetical protein
MKHREPKKYRVTLEFRQKESFDVEAENEQQAEKEALEQISVGLNATHYDTTIKELS